MQYCTITMYQWEKNPSKPSLQSLSTLHGFHCYPCLMVPLDFPVHFQTHRYIYAHTDRNFFFCKRAHRMDCCPCFFKNMIPLFVVI